MSKVFNYKNTKSADGSYTASLSKKLTERLNNYCRAFNVNRRRFVEKAVESALNGAYERKLNEFTKEDVIQLYLNSIGEQSQLDEYSSEEVNGK